MSPEQQFSASTKYQAQPFCIIPVGPDLFHIYSGFNQRQFLAEVAAADLSQFLTESFHANKPVTQPSRFETDPLLLDLINFKL